MGLSKKLALSRSGKKGKDKDADGTGAVAATLTDAEPAVPEEHVPDVVQDAAAHRHTKQDGGGGGLDGHREDDDEPPWQLTGAWLQRAREELLEDPEKTPELLDRLRVLVQEDSELRARCDDAFLIRFLRARKFNVSKAHKTLQRYYQMKQKHPNLFRADNTDRLKVMMASEMHGVLDGRDNDGCRVITVKIEHYDGSVHSVDDFFRLNVIALEQLVRDPETQVSGVSVIVDLAGFGVHHAPFLVPYYVRNTSEVIQESFPLRFKGFRVVNQPFYFAALFAIIKPFLKEKMKRRVILCGSRYDKLHQDIAVDLLPQKYGGPAGGFEYKRWAESVRALEGYFSRLESFGYPAEGEGTGRRRLSLFSLGRRQSQVSSDGRP